MKLRLPHRLQTAILTAFASVTFFTVGTATLGAARGEEAPEFASFTDTGVEVSEEELEVDLGEEEEEETKEPDSAPANHAGFNGIRESSDDADRQLANGDISESTSDTENVGTADQANYTGTSADLPSNDLGFTANPYASGSDTSNGSGVDSPVTSFTQAPQIAPTGGDSAAGTGSGSSTNKTTTGAIGSVARSMALTASNPLSPVSSPSVGTGSSGSALPALTGAAGSVASAPTYSGDNLVTPFTDAENHVVYNGFGTFYVQTKTNVLSLQVTLCLESLAEMQAVHDYHDYSPSVTWAYEGYSAYGLSDFKTTDASGLTGYWNGAKWTNQGTISYSSLMEESQAGADGKHYVTLDIINQPSQQTGSVLVSTNGKQIYSGNGLRSDKFTGPVTSFTINTQYITSVTLNSISELDVEHFDPPIDYSIPFVSQKTDGNTVGRIMFIGDSITHGEYDATWRWQLFKSFVDNDTEYQIAGPKAGLNHTTPFTTTDFNITGENSYGGVEFDNLHYAQSSGRTRNIINGGGVAATYNYVVNGESHTDTTGAGASYGGSANSADKVGQRYDCNSYVMLMGTNDLLSDTKDNDYVEKYVEIAKSLLGGSVTGTGDQQGNRTLSWSRTDSDGWGNVGTIISEMNMVEGDTFYLLSVPTWARSGNHNNYADHTSAQAYNSLLSQWVEAYNAAHANQGTVVYVDINKGLVDVTENIPFYSNRAFFNNGKDGLHPSQQGSLIIAGNIAQAIGLGGRTAGLSRADATTEGTSWTAADQIQMKLTSAGAPVTLASGAFSAAQGYTVDFQGLFGDGAVGGWLDASKDYANSVSMLTTFSTVSNALTFTVGDGTSTGTLKLSEGYVLWNDAQGDHVLYSRDNSQAGDNLRIAYTAGSVEDNIGAGYYVWLGDMLIGQALSAGTGTALNGISISVSGTGTGTVNRLTYSNTGYAPLIGASPIPVPSHDNMPTHSGVDFTGATTINNQKGITSSSQFAGDAVFEQSNRSSWIAASGVDFAHSITAKIDGGNTITASIFGVQGGTTQGDVTLDISNVTIGNAGSYNGATAAIAGAYSAAKIKGTFTVYVTNSTIGGNIVGGAVGGAGSVGAFELYLNSGTVNGSIYGGPNGGNNAGGTIGDVSITINGGHVTGDINGGAQKGSVTGNSTIVVKGGIIDGNIIGAGVAEGKSSTVTIESNKPLIGGNITADAVVIRNVTPAGVDDFFDTYAGTITGNTSITLDGYAVQDLDASLVTRTLNLINSSSTTIRDLTLTACEINVDGTSSATLADSVTLGNTATYTGTLNLADGLEIDVTGMGITGEEESVNLFTTQSGTLNANASQLTIVGLAQDAPAYHLSNTNNNLVLTFGAPPQDLIWDGSTNTHWSTDQDDLNWHTSASTEPHLPFATGDNVTFTSGVTNTPVLQTDIEAGTMTLTNGGSTVTINTNGNNLTVNNLVSADAATDNKFTKTGAGTATFNGNSTVYFDVLSIGADAGTTIFNQHVVQTGTTRFDVSSDVSFLNGYEYTGTQGYGLLVTNSATVTLGGESNMSNKNVGMTNSNAKLVLAENASLTVQNLMNSTSGKGPSNGTLDMRSGSVLTLTGQNLYLTGATSDGGTIHLGNNAVVNLYAGSYQPNIMVFGLGNIALDGNSPTATIKTTNWGGTVKLDSLSGSGTLVLRAEADSSVRNTFSIGGNAEAPSFNGSIELQREGGSSRVLVAEFNDAESAAGAVVQTKLTGNHTSESVGIAINSSTVKMKGLNDGTGITSASSYALFSGSASRLNAVNSNASTYLDNASDSTARTLEFVGTDATASSSTAIKVLNNVNLKMSSAGSQSFTGNLSSMNGAVTASAGTLTLDNSGATAGSLASATVNGGTLVLDDMNVAGAVTLSSGTLDLLSDTSTGAFALNGGTLKFADAGSLAITGSLNIGGSSVLDLSRITVSGPSNITLASTTAGVTGNLGDITLQGFSPLAGYDAALQTIDNNLVLTFTPLAQDLIWDGGAATWDVDSTAHWHEDGQEPGTSTFAQDSNVVFASGESTPTLGANITAGTMTLEKDAVVKVDRAGHTFTATLAGEGTYVLPTNTTTLGEGVSLGTDWDGIVRLSSTGEQKNVDIRPLATEDSWVEFNGFTGYTNSWATSAGGQYNIEFSQNVILTNPDDSTPAYKFTAFAGTLYTMYATGDWKGNGEFRFAGEKQQGVKFTGDISGWTGKLSSYATDRRDVTFAGDAGTVKVAIDKQGTGALNVIVGDGSNSFAATFTNTVNASSLNVTNKATATLENTATLGSLSGAGTLVVDGTGNTVTINGSGGHTGAITVSSGTLVAGTQNALGTGAITVDGGTLDLRTANTMGALTLTSGTLKLAGEGNLTTGALTFGNGFTLDLANIHPTAGTDTITLATTSGISGDLNAVTLNNLSAPTGYEGVLTDNNNSLVLTFTPIDNSLVWDNNGNTSKWNTTDANWHVGKAAPGTSTFSDNADVKFTKATNGQTVTLAAATTAGDITIDEGANITIQNDGKALAGTLKGSGTYALKSGVYALPGSLNVKDEGWTGTVKLTGVGIQNIDLNSYGHAGSKVEFDGVSGHFLQTDSALFEPTLVLSGGGLTVNNAYSNYEYIFAGGVEGGGNINATYASGGSNNKFTFTGSVKDWTGAFTVAGGKGATLKFVGNADTVNATIGQASGGGTINLEVGNGADTFSTTFNKAVNASKMEVKQSASATINETSSLGNLVGPGNVIVDNASTLTVGSATGGYVNVTVKDGATLAINGKDGTDYKMHYTLDGGTLTNTGNNTGGGSIQNDQITLTKDSTISGTGNFYMLGSNYNKTELHLDTHTLEKTGTNEITMYSTEVSGGGTLKITNGSLNITRHTSDKPMSLVNANIVLNKGGAESLKGDFNLAANNSISSTVSDARMTANVAMQGATTLGAEENCSLTASGVLSGSAPITKTGDGTVVLTGNNSYTGGTTVSGGKLVAGSANALGNGDVLVNNGGALELTSSLTSISGNLTVNDGTLTFAGPENLTTTGEFTFGSGATLDLTNIHPGSFTDSITLATATGGISGNVGAVTLTNLVAPEGYKGILSTVGNDLVLTFTEQRDLVWQGGSGDWDTESDNKVWFESETSQNKVAFQDGDSVSFLVPGNSPVSVTENIAAGDVFVGADVEVSLSNGSTTGEVELDAGAIDVKGDLTVTDVTVQAQSMQIEEGASVTAAVTDAGGPASLAADISGAGDMAKTGAGTLNLTGDNAGYTGTVTISGGTVNADGTGTSTALGNTPNVVMAGEGVELSGSIAPTGNINITTTADATNSTVSANMVVEDGSLLTFNTYAGTTLTATGTISGDGGILKDGKGTLVLNNTANTFTGGVDIKEGTVLVTKSGALGASGTRNVNVENGSSLAFATGVTESYSVNTVSVSSGSSLVFSGTNQLHIDTLNITAASAMDLTNISLDNYGSYVLATVDSFVPAEVGIWKPGKNLVEFVSMTGIHGSALTPDSLVSLYYEGGQLVLKLNKPNDGFYWKPSEETGVTTWNTKDDNWSSTPDLSGSTHFVSEQTVITTGERARSAYFMNEGEEHIVMGINGSTYVRDMIVANGKYYFTAPEGTETSISLSTTDLSNFVVRSGAEAHFDGVSVGTGEKDVIHICSEATATMENVSNWGVYSMNNEGTFSVDSNCMGIGESILGHVDNTGDFSAYYRTEDGILLIGEMANREGAKMVLSGHWLAANEQYGNGFIANDGELTFDATGFENGQMYNYIPVTGIGTLETKGEDRIVFSSEESSIFFTASSATVEQTAMTLGAAENIFGEAVQIADSTTVLSGSEATFYGGGSLGDLALTPGGSDNLTKATLGGYNHNGTDIHDSTYNVGAVTAGENTVLTVENGAVATVGSYNAGDTPAGTIVVGAPTSQTSGTYSAASLTVNGLTNVETLDVQNGTANLVGYATVGTLTQSGGTLNLNAGGYVENATVSGGTLDIGDDMVLTLGDVITENGSYTVAATTGSINADALTLEMSKDNVQYTEIGYTETPTEAQSGFLSSGEQYVKVFDIQSGTLTGHDVTVTHKDAAGPMTLISTGKYAGYGYLDSSETVYTTYYVRDNYVTGAADGRTDEHGKHTADEVKLSDITSAATAGGETLAAVVFDQTAYNSGVENTNYHGTLTVDENTKADLFHVTEEGAEEAPDTTRAAINIAENVVVLADQDYAGVEGTLELAGSGVYQIDNRGDLGENVSLLADTTDGISPWAGTVRLTGTAEDLDMAPLSVGVAGNASTIEFNQWTGTFAATEEPMESDAKILLTGTGTVDAPAITFAATESDAPTRLVWTNTVTGENAGMINQTPGDVEITMTGDTSGWGGTFYQDSAESTATLNFLPNGEGDTQNATMLVEAGTLNVTYGGNLKDVNGAALLTGADAELNLAYTGTNMQVNSDISQYHGQGNLSITVGDDEGTEASASFNGAFSNTQGTTMTVKENAAATFNTNAALLRVVGEEGSAVAVNSGKTLSLASIDPDNSYSEFHGLTNDGTIEMEADGGSIHLVVDNGVTAPTYKVGDLDLVGDAGTAVIQTAANGQTVKVEITDLSGPNSADQVLQLKNSDASGTVNYNLGGDTHFTGTIEFGSNGSAGNTNVVLNSDGVAANAVLKSTGSGSGTEDVVVNTADAKVLGIDSSGNASGTLYGTDGSQKVVTVTGDGTYSYNGALGKNLDIAYTGKGTQTFEGGAANFSGKVTVDNGTAAPGILEIQNASSVSISDLTIGVNNTLDLNDGSNVGTAEVSGTMKAKGTAGNYSKLDGNLTMGSDSTYDVSAAGGTGGLDLGGALTISNGATLSANDIANIYNMEIGEMYDLAFDVTKFNGSTTASGFEDKVPFGDPIDASTLFGNDQFWEGEYYVCFSGAGTNGGNGNNVGTVYLYKATPEPTTGTLSLLALAALAARRRKR